MSEAEQTERKEIGRIKLSDNQDLIASVVDDQKFKLSIADKRDNKKLELSIVDKSMKDKNNQKKKEGWLFGVLTISFGWLKRWINACELVGVLCSKTNDRGYYDYWVLGSLVLSIALWIIMSYFGYIGWLGWLIVGCSIWRIYESVLITTNSALFAREQAKRKGGTQDILSSERRVVYALITYLGLSFWFAIFYMKFHCLFESPRIRLSSLIGSWYFSVTTMSTLGYGDIFPTTEWGGVIAICQTMIGILFAIVIVGSFVSWIKQPEVPRE